MFYWSCTEEFFNYPGLFLGLFLIVSGLNQTPRPSSAFLTQTREISPEQLPSPSLLLCYCFSALEAKTGARGRGIELLELSMEQRQRQSQIPALGKVWENHRYLISSSSLIFG